MTEKRYYRTNTNIYDNITNAPYYSIRDRKKEESNVLFIVGGKNTSKNIIDLLNEQEERIKELENKLNQTALEFLNHETISMGKAVEISEMSYHDFLKYRAEHGNPMELQL